MRRKILNSIEELKENTKDITQKKKDKKDKRIGKSRKQAGRSNILNRKKFRQITK